MIYHLFLFVTLAITFISNNESWVRKLNLKLKLVPESNVFRDTTPYWIMLTIIFGIDYLRGMII